MQKFQISTALHGVFEEKSSGPHETGDSFNYDDSLCLKTFPGISALLSRYRASLDSYLRENNPHEFYFKIKYLNESSHTWGSYPGFSGTILTSQKVNVVASA